MGSVSGLVWLCRYGVMSALLSLIQEVDQFIKKGELSKARSLLKTLEVKKIPREHSWAVSELTRRAQWPSLGLRILNPVVRSEKPLAQPPTAQERSLYAALLAQVGVRGEAREILESLKSESTPEICFYWLYVLIPDWNYRAAIPYLKRYLRYQEITLYQKTVAWVNLAASYIFVQDFFQAHRTLDKIAGFLKKNPTPLLEKNYWELRVQAYIQQKEFDRARESLQKISARQESASDIYELYVEKWKYLIDLADGHTWIPEEWQKLRKLATELQDWETLRDLDLQTGLKRGDEELILKAYYGSPSPEYRKKILTVLNQKPTRAFRLDLFTMRESSSEKYFSLKTGLLREGRGQMKPGQVLHRCFSALLADLYRPKTINALFSDLFVNEYFNPVSSPARVSQVIFRLNAWFRKHGWPLTIECKNHQFYLKASDHFVVELSSSSGPSSALAIKFETVKSHFGDQWFTSKDLIELFKISKRSAQSICQFWSKEGKIHSLGQARNIRFQIKTTNRRWPSAS